MKSTPLVCSDYETSNNKYLNKINVGSQNYNTLNTNATLNYNTLDTNATLYRMKMMVDTNHQL